MTDGNRGDYTRDNGDPDKERPSLTGLAKQWATPNVPNGGRVNPPGTGPTGMTPDGRKKQVGLEDQVKQWPTPAARDHKGSLPLDARDRTMGTLDEAAERRFRCTPPDRPTHAGRACSILTPCSSPPLTAYGSGPLRAEISVYRRWSGNRCATVETGAAGWRGTWIRKPRAALNPRFVEWLMGWPIGWTGCASPVTGSTRYKQRMRTELCRLCSPRPAAQGRLL